MMVQKINHTNNQLNSSLPSSNKSTKGATNALTSAQSSHHQTASTPTTNTHNLSQARALPSLAVQLSHLMQHIVALDPSSVSKLNQLLAQLLPTTPEQLLTLLSHLLVHPKHKFQGLLLLWARLKQQQKLDSGFSNEVNHLLEKMQLKHIDQSNQQVWLLQLPWFVDLQLKPLQLKLIKPKTKQKKRKWQLKLKLPTKQSEMLADCWLDDGEIDLKIYCDNTEDLAQVSQYSPLLINQLEQAGFATTCQHFMGQVPSDLAAEFDDSQPRLDILV